MILDFNTTIDLTVYVVKRVYQSNFGITIVFELKKIFQVISHKLYWLKMGKHDWCRSRNCITVHHVYRFDIPTIESALRHGRSRMLKVSITLMLGLYNQRFDVDTSNFQSNSDESKIVVIRTAFPHLGAGWVYYEPRRDGASACRDHSCIDIHTSINSLSSNYRGSHGHTTIWMSHLQLLHCSPGSDI